MEHQPANTDHACVHWYETVQTFLTTSDLPLFLNLLHHNDKGPWWKFLNSPSVSCSEVKTLRQPPPHRPQWSSSLHLENNWEKADFPEPGSTGDRGEVSLFLNLPALLECRYNHIIQLFVWLGTSKGGQSPGRTKRIRKGLLRTRPSPPPRIWVVGSTDTMLTTSFCNCTLFTEKTAAEKSPETGLVITPLVLGCLWLYCISD